MSKIVEKNLELAIILPLIALILFVDLAASDCSGTSHPATATSYYPSNDGPEGGFKDCQENPLHTLEQFLNGQASYVSVAMDQNLNIKYGTEICIPELNSKYNRQIVFKVVDTGPAFTGTGYSRIDICVDTYQHAVDGTVPTQVTIHFPNIQYGNTHCTV